MFPFVGKSGGELLDWGSTVVAFGVRRKADFEGVVLIGDGTD